MPSAPITTSAVAVVPSAKPAVARPASWLKPVHRCPVRTVLGWTTVAGRQYYVRQFRNMKGSVTLDSIDGAALADYDAITGHLLAKGHARTSGASMIVGYAGSSDRLDIALARFARLYADQTEADHAALVKAADHGVVPVARGL